MNIFKRKRNNIFLRLLIDQANKTFETLELLEEFMKTEEKSIAGQVDNKEKEGDEIRRILINEINKSFSTPFDREDIFNLSRAIDDILDYANTTIDEMNILEIKTNKYLLEMSEILKNSGRNLFQAIKTLSEYPKIATDHIIKVKGFENRLEKLYRSAVSDLFKMPKDITDIIYVLKTREIYRHLSNACDKCDEAADLIGDILVKNY
ncbi:MAG: DUF47 family protein [Cyanobacteria bacterium]|nr:DUF47 family protein [Cyanobacteriota bacterium]